MTSRISLIAAVFAAGTLASCGGGVSTVSSVETETATALTAPTDMGSPADMGSQGDSHYASMETSQEPSAPSASPIPDTGGMTRNVVDGICEGTTCVVNEYSSGGMAGVSGADDFVSARNDQ